jgi:hypothetical protein
MSLCTESRHPRAHARRSADPARTEEPVTFNERIAARITASIGSMWTVYICLAITLIWMLVASRQVLGVRSISVPVSPVPRERAPAAADLHHPARAASARACDCVEEVTDRIRKFIGTQEELSG